MLYKFHQILIIIQDTLDNRMKGVVFSQVLFIFRSFYINKLLISLFPNEYYDPNVRRACGYLLEQLYKSYCGLKGEGGKSSEEEDVNSSLGKRSNEEQIESDELRRSKRIKENNESNELSKEMESINEMTLIVNNNKENTEVSVTPTSTSGSKLERLKQQATKLQIFKCRNRVQA